MNKRKNKGWIAVDLDGTLAHYTGWRGVEHIGDPIPAMAERVRKWLKAGEEVRIFTARVSHDDFVDARMFIQDWCEMHFGVRLEVTCIKDFKCREIWDDRAVAVEQNTGKSFTFRDFTT